MKCIIIAVFCFCYCAYSSTGVSGSPIPTFQQVEIIKQNPESSVTSSAGGKPNAFQYQYTIVHPSYSPNFYHITPQIAPLGYYSHHPFYNTHPFQQIILLDPKHPWILQDPQVVQPDGSKVPESTTPATVQPGTPVEESFPNKEQDNEIPPPVVDEEKPLDDSSNKGFDLEGLQPTDDADTETIDSGAPLARDGDENEVAEEEKPLDDSISVSAAKDAETEELNPTDADTIDKDAPSARNEKEDEAGIDLDKIDAEGLETVPNYDDIE